MNMVVRHPSWGTKLGLQLYCECQSQVWKVPEPIAPFRTSIKTRQCTHTQMWSDSAQQMVKYAYFKNFDWIIDTTALLYV